MKAITTDNQFIPRSRFSITTHRDSIRLNRKLRKKQHRMKFFWSFVTFVALMVATYPLLPLFVYQTGGSDSFVGRLVQGPLGLDIGNNASLNSANPSITGELSQGAGGNEAGTTQTASAASGQAQNQLGGGAVNDQIQGNTLVIPKIGVNISIVESNNAEWAWDRGAWRDPGTSTPDQGSNTALSAHRFRYRPPYRATFYLLDKLDIGDQVYVYWEGKKYTYKVVSEDIVSPSATQVLNPTETPTITLITCHPLFSTESRLVIRAELVNVE